MEAEVDVVVIGAGALGLSCASELASAGQSVVVLERLGGIARDTTSRNSEVIHSGIYYPQKSLKAEFCVKGRELIYERCEKLNIPFNNTGKLIVAIDESEVSVLEDLIERGTNNGAPDLVLIDGDQVHRWESEVQAVAGIYSPRTGIVDAHALCQSWLVQAEDRGAIFLPKIEVIAIENTGRSYRVTVRDADGSQTEIKSRAVVNAAGLSSDRIASLVGIDIDEAGYRIHLCKGDYFTLNSLSPLRFSRLVYPIQHQSGLGIHVTIDLHGRARLGPDANYVGQASYSVDPNKAKVFAEAAGRYLPRLKEEWLTPDYAGLRPKLSGPGATFRDFIVKDEIERGLPGFINLIGIESPGLTAAPAIALKVLSFLT